MAPLIVHHMAALDGRFPPNSLEAIRACLEAKVAFIEVDITALADGDYLLVHDETLESETTGSGAVSGCSAEQVRDLRIKGSAYPVPLLSDVVRLFADYAQTATRLQLDYKSVFPFPDDEPIERLVRLIAPLRERVIVSSGADWQLRKLRHYAAWLDLGFDVQFYIDWREAGQAVDPRQIPKHLGAYGYWDDHPLAQAKVWRTADYLADKCGQLIGLVPRLSTFYISHKLLAQALDDGFNWAEMLHAHQIKLDAWTLDAGVGKQQAEVNAVRLLAAGVDQFTTNTPAALSSLLAGVNVPAAAHPAPPASSR
jgi:glycerophosphoryl diester phosphodiesterase